MSEEAKQSGIPSPQADAAPGVLAATNEAPEGTARTAVIEAQQNGSVKDDAPDAATSSEQANENVQQLHGEPNEQTPVGDETAVQYDNSAETPTANDATIVHDDADTLASKAKSTNRRKSNGIPEHKKKLNKKASKANLTHTDAKPGDHFFARLKGFPPWPVVICDEEMLPSELIKSRPVTAARADGTYRAENADGGLKVKDRTFPIMYLYTNEFGWIKNTDLHDLDVATVGTVSQKMRKDLQAAHQLASQGNDLEYYKDVLRKFVEQREAELLAKREAAEAKEAKAAKAKANKVKPQKTISDDDNDIEMADAEVDSEGASSVSKKRKAEEEGNVSQPGDTKKVKLALKFKAPQTPNGNSTSKVTKDTPASKSAKPKPKKDKATPKTAAPEAVTPKEPELSVEEKRAKKEKEILFLRHKLQKGLLTRDQPPKEDEMKNMSEFISKLEGYSELEVSIIRSTKINKVLKAIIKLNSIPKEEEFKFKSRSQTLLDKWNKLLAGEQAPTAPPTSVATTNGTSEVKSESKDETPSHAANEAQDKEETAKFEDKQDSVEAVPETESKDAVLPTDTRDPTEGEQKVKEKHDDTTIVDKATGEPAT